MDTKINIIALHNQTGVSYHRVIKPMKRLEMLHSNTFNVFYIDIGNIDFSSLPDLKKTNIDIIYFNTIIGINTNNSLIPYLEACLMKGAKVVLDIDDYFKLGKSVIANPKTIRLHGEHIPDAVKNADYVTTTTEIFKDMLSEINPRVTVFPNFADSFDSQYDLNKTPILKNKDGDTVVRIGLTGAAFHRFDYKQLEGVTYHLKKRGLNNRFKIVLCGYCDNKPYQDYEKILTSDYRIVKREYQHQLTSSHDVNLDKDGESYQRIGWKSTDEYMTFYDNFDVLIAPLENTAFNAAKSPIKYVEAAWKEVLFVGSDVPAYNAYVENGYNGFLCKKAIDWVNTLEHIITKWDETNGFYSIIQNAKNDVIANYESVNVTKKRADFFIEIVNDK